MVIASAAPVLVYAVLARQADRGLPPGPDPIPGRPAIERLHTDIVVLRDGSVLVTETWSLPFNRRPERFTRQLPVLGPADPSGGRRPDIDVLDVSPHRRTRVRNARGLRYVHTVWRDSQRPTLRIRYRVDDAVRRDRAAGLDGLVWEIYPPAPGLVPAEVTATVRLPGGSTVVTAGAEIVRPVDGDDAPWLESGDDIVPIRTLRPDQRGALIAVTGITGLAPAERLRLSAQWPTGAVQHPVEVRGMRRAAERFWPLALPFFAFFFGFQQWWRRGREPAERAVTVYWEPPEDMSPAEAGTLIDHRVNARDMVALIVDLAVRGVLEVEPIEDTGALHARNDFAFHLVKPSHKWDVPHHQRVFLDAVLTQNYLHGDVVDGDRIPYDNLFGVVIDLVNDLTSEPLERKYGALASRKMSHVRAWFGRRVGKVAAAIYQSLQARGFYATRPDLVAARWTTAAVTLAAAGAAVALFLPRVPLWVALTGFGGAALITFGFARVMPARTVRGARAREKLLGFKQFLERVELPRYRRMIKSPDDFEAFLPYAVAFGVQENWARAFDGILTRVPGWYRGQVFTPSAFGEWITRAVGGRTGRRAHTPR